jgi:acetyltransferase
MHGLFYPESIVVIGVSEATDNLGKNVISNLVNLGYRGTIYPVGPKGGKVFGLPVYRSVSELPGEAELAVILTPARFVSDMLAQCCEKGTSWAVISTAGFRELGSEGETLERGILETSVRCAIRFVGPNCVGIANSANGFYCPFPVLPEPFRKGNTAISAQSGGVGLSLCLKLSSSGVGIGKFVSMGNKLDLDEVDYLAYLMDDPETALIYFYLEDFKRGRQFAELARKCSKPIILHKSNTSAVSSTIARSHTAALAGDDRVVDALCRETGILRVRSISDGINAAKGLSLPPLRGNNLAVLSRSGGHAVTAADACAAHGFNLPALAQDVIEEAKTQTRANVIQLGNPLDLGDIFNLPFYARLVEKILCQSDIDGILFVHVSQMMVELNNSRGLVEKMSALSSQFGKPVATVLEIPMEERVRLEKTSDFPLFLDSAEAIEALAANLQWNKTVAAHAKSESAMRPARLAPAAAAVPKDRGLAPEADPGGVKSGVFNLETHSSYIEKWLDDVKKQNRQPLLHESLELLDFTGIPTAPWRFVKTMDELIETAVGLGFPVALKAVAPSLLHKSDKGALALNIAGVESLRDEWRRLQEVSDDISGIVVQKMIPASRELVAGGKRDPSFGPLVLTGLGGILVEVMNDVSMRLAPIDIDSAMEMFGELSGRRILGKFRGMQEADLQTAARILVKVSQLMHHFPQIEEMDLNPISLNDAGRGALALDARVLISV